VVAEVTLIPYLIEKYIETRDQIKKQKDDNIEEIIKSYTTHISSLKTMAYHLSPTALDTYINLNPGTIIRPYGKLGGRRRTITRKYERSRPIILNLQGCK
jgi:hypothetical protein